VYISNMDKLPVDNATAERLMLGSDQITVLATCAQTNDALFAVEVRMPPGGGPPVLHRHAPGEIYYVTEGEFTFYTVDDHESVQRVTAGVGQAVPLAGGTPHTVRNESNADAAAFVVHAPGAPMEHFIRAAAELAQAGSPSMESVLALADQNGIEMLGPIPAVG
ncbi:MAG TPA: cupin domain-containing protein, partial [Propionibacteriaceae bacterium]|nr:cupin domain-containing protein [Propionibacteriaceae bacterium]